MSFWQLQSEAFKTKTASSFILKKQTKPDVFLTHVFTDKKEFLEWFKKLDKGFHMHYYEVLHDDIKECYDIDVKSSTLTVQEVFDDVMKSIADARSEFDESQYRVLDSSTDEKISLHISNPFNTMTVNTLISLYKKIPSEHIDRCIARENGLMRLIYSRKNADKRKAFKPATWHKYSIDAPDEDFLLQTDH